MVPPAGGPFDPRDRWKQLQREAIKDGGGTGLNFPVQGRDHGQNDWNPFQWDLIKELCKTVTTYGLSALYTQSLLENVMTGQLLTPFDI